MNIRRLRRAALLCIRRALSGRRPRGPGLDGLDGAGGLGAGTRRPSSAGRLLVARRGGYTLVSFSNPPLPIFTARATPDAWRLEFGGRGRSYSGRGRAPARFVWFALPTILAGGAPPPQWQIERPAGDEIELTHARGEHLRLVIDR